MKTAALVLAVSGGAYVLLCCGLALYNVITYVHNYGQYGGPTWERRDRER